MRSQDLAAGTLLETGYDETLEVTAVDDDSVTWDELADDGSVVCTETFPHDEVQAGLDYSDITVAVSASERIADAEDDFGTMEIVDTDPEEIGEPNLYIRFGAAPADERSWDARNERKEDGVSVYDAVREDGVYCPTGQMALGALLMMHRDTYLVTGERVGTGADGEPLLRNVEAVAELSTPKGTEGWLVSEEAN